MKAYCDRCNHLGITEKRQQRFRKAIKEKRMRDNVVIDHSCNLTRDQLFHNGQAPRIPRPANCPVAARRRQRLAIIQEGSK